MKPITLQEIALLTGGELIGDPSVVVCNADIIRDSEPGFLTFAEKPEYFEQVMDSPVAAVLISSRYLEIAREELKKPFVVVEDAAAGFSTVVSYFRTPIQSPVYEVSSAAFVDPTAKLGKGVTVDQGAVVGAQVVIGDHCRIHSGVKLSDGCQIGDETEIFSNATLYENTIVGKRCLLHANCVLGAFGFGYKSTGEGHQLSVQLGYVELGDDVDIGAGATIDRGTYGATRIGAGTKIDNLVQIGHNCRIGKRNLICALVGIAGSCTTGDDVVMAGQVGIGDHLNIGDKVILGAKAGVMADIEENQVFVGIPATPAKLQMQIIASKHRLPEMRKRINRLEKELDSLRASIDCTDNDNEMNAA